MTINVGQTYTVQATLNEFIGAFQEDQRNRHLSHEDHIAIFNLYRNHSPVRIKVLRLAEKTACVQIVTESFSPAFWIQTRYFGPLAV